MRIGQYYFRPLSKTSGFQHLKKITIETECLFTVYFYMTELVNFCIDNRDFDLVMAFSCIFLS